MYNNTQDSLLPLLTFSKIFESNESVNCPFMKYPTSPKS